jgi:arylsulfatase A-like enzyme
MKALFLIFSIILFVGCTDNQKEKQTPNIVLIVADDLGWKDVGYNGAEFYETPHIDQLAADGMVFNRFYPGAANCAPSRATLLTGMYMPRHDVYIPQGLARGGETSKMRFKVPTQGEDSTFNTFHVNINHVEPEFESLAEMLKKAGYTSARIGKWHIGDDNQGFDWVSANGDPGFITNKNGDEQRFYADVHVAEKMTNTALQFIQENQEQPFFLYLSHWEVHTPIKAREERTAYFEKKKAELEMQDANPVYAAEIEQVDLSVGRVLKKLEELDLDENTLVIFTSDNGGVSAQTSNLPLRAGKGTYYEGGIRVPFCIKYPGVTKAGSQTDIPVNGVDFIPTFAEIAHAELPQNQPVDGLSFLPILKNEPFEAERPVFFHFPLYIGGGNKDKVLPAFDGTPDYWRGVPSTTMISGDWKMIYYYEYESFELYNLKDDISEQNDLSKSNPEKANQLLGQMKAWVKEVDAPVPNVLNTD